jgi:hypothetical protein
MSRLLFAAARGARILYGSGRLPTYLVCLEKDAVQFIHQDDEHLQYGPISTAYREAAESPPIFPDVIVGNVGSLVTPYPMLSYYKKLSPIGKQFYLLLFSEYLADEGL